MSIKETKRSIVINTNNELIYLGNVISVYLDFKGIRRIIRIVLSYFDENAHHCLYEFSVYDIILHIHVALQ